MDEIAQFHARRNELEQKVEQAVRELLAFTRADSFTLPLGDGRHVAVGTPEYLARATDMSGAKPYLGND